MTNRKSIRSKQSTQTAFVFLAVGVASLLGFLIISSVLDSGSQDEKALNRLQAEKELQNIQNDIEKLEDTCRFAQTIERLEAFKKKYPSFCEEPENQSRVSEALSKVETKRESRFKKDWARFLEVQKSRDKAVLASIVQEVKEYGTPSQCRRIESLYEAYVEKMRKRRKGLERLKEVKDKALALAEKRRISDAIKLISDFELEHPGLLEERAVSLVIEQATEEINRIRERIFENDMERFRKAGQKGDLSICEEVKEAVARYGTSEQIRKIGAELAEAREEAEKAKRARSYTRIEPAGRSTSQERDHETERVQRPREQTPEYSSGATETPAFHLTEREVKEYLREAEGAWKKPLRSPGSEAISGSVSLVTDSLGYKLSKMALEELRKGTPSEKIAQSLRNYASGLMERREIPLMIVRLSCKKGWALFFEKGTPLRSYFHIKYGDRKLTRQIVEDNLNPQYRGWRIYVKDRYKIARSSAALWCFEGSMRLVFRLKRPWKRMNLSVQMAGPLHSQQFGKGPAGWRGWNPLQRIIQFYKGDSPQFQSSVAIFQFRKKEQNKIPLPSAIEELLGTIR